MVCEVCGHCFYLISLFNRQSALGYQRLKENVTNGKGDNHETIDFFRRV